MSGPLRILCVCSGNTCRSPMLKALLRLIACKHRDHSRAHVALTPGAAPLLDPSPDPAVPASSPLVATWSWGGEPATEGLGVRLWGDGTIIVSGNACTPTRRFTLPPARVAELAAALRLLDLDDMTRHHDCDDPKDSSPRIGSTFVSVDGDRFERGLCDPSDPGFDNALELIHTAVGTLPCTSDVLTR